MHPLQLIDLTQRVRVMVRPRAPPLRSTLVTGAAHVFAGTGPTTARFICDRESVSVVAAEQVPVPADTTQGYG